MGKRHLPARRDAVSEEPQGVLIEVTVVPDPHARAPQERSPGISGGIRRYGLGALALGLAALAIVALAERGNHGSPGRSVTVTQERGPAKVAAAYGYPFRCLSGASAAADRAHPRADFKHLILCGQYPGYPAEGFPDLTQARRPMLVRLPLPGSGR